MKVYCDTSTLWNNVTRHDDVKTLKELRAFEKLLALRRKGKVKMVRSHVVLRELERTKDDAQLISLRADFEGLEQVPLDEKVVGFHNQYSNLGGGSYPLVSDVQDERLRDELLQRGLDRGDAEHLTQAWANGCDAFLTRDEDSIVNPHGEWLECKLAPLKIRLPSQLLAESES